MTPDKNSPSLENLIETLDLGEEVLHPGGLDTTRELAELCHVESTSRVLDVASGTGEPLCFLAETFHCQGVGVDFSEAMVRRAQKKTEESAFHGVILQGRQVHVGVLQHLQTLPDALDARTELAWREGDGDRAVRAG